MKFILEEKIDKNGINTNHWHIFRISEIDNQKKLVAITYSFLTANTIIDALNQMNKK